MKKILILSLIAITAISCQDKSWKFEKTIPLDDIHPIGITVLNDTLWLSDGNNNRLVAINEKGKMLQQIKGLERPMHISTSESQLLVPEYGRDRISIISSSRKIDSLDTPKLDAPASIHKVGNTIAIADFYNHNISFFSHGTWKQIGKKGSQAGELNYPTDVQIVDNKLYVADAYNHRVQVFSTNGNWLQTFGEDQQMNAATGIYVCNSKIYVTDFENNRVLLLNSEGKLIQELKDSINHPTDVVIHNDKLWILNFKEGSISRYTY